MTLGEKLKELRLAKKLTQGQVGKKFYMTHGAISHYERGRIFPPLPIFKALADFYEISADELLKTVPYSTEVQV